MPTLRTHIKTEDAHIHPDDPAHGYGGDDDQRYKRQLEGYCEDNNLDLERETAHCLRPELWNRRVDSCEEEQAPATSSDASTGGSKMSETQKPLEESVLDSINRGLKFLHNIPDEAAFYRDGDAELEEILRKAADRIAELEKSVSISRECAEFFVETLAMFDQHQYILELKAALEKNDDR